MNIINCSLIVFMVARYRFRLGNDMNIRTALGGALKTVRRGRGLTQEDFSNVSSRTYLSMLERGLQSPTIDKLQELSEVLEVHPLTILSIAYMEHDGRSAEALFTAVKRELESLVKE